MQSWGNALNGLDRVREAAKRDKRLRFTALLHHVSVALRPPMPIVAAGLRRRFTNFPGAPLCSGGRQPSCRFRGGSVAAIVAAPARLPFIGSRVVEIAKSGNRAPALQGEFAAVYPAKAAA
jgi:hypothetical protein